MYRLLSIGFSLPSPAPAHSRALLHSDQEARPMSVSSISSPPPTPANYLQTNAPQTPAATADNDSNDNNTTQAPAPAPLPPGQGTRVDQLV
jgi:hypothetical protein